MKSKINIFLLPFLLITILIVSGCNSNTGSSASASDSYVELLKSLHQDGGFVFEGQPWFSSRNDVAEQQKIEDSKATDFLKSEGVFALEKGPLTKITLFRFSDEEFVSGEYLFSTDDKELFTQFVNSLKTELAGDFPKPRSTDLNALVADDSAQGNSVLWEGEDNSRLSITILGKQDTESTYNLLIKSSSPLARKELAP